MDEELDGSKFLPITPKIEYNCDPLLSCKNLVNKLKREK